MSLPTLPSIVLGCGFSTLFPTTPCSCSICPPDEFIRKLRKLCLSLGVSSDHPLSSTVMLLPLEITEDCHRLLVNIEQCSGYLVCALAGHYVFKSYPKPSADRFVFLVLSAIRHAEQAINLALCKRLQADIILAQKQITKATMRLIQQDFVFNQGRNQEDAIIALQNASEDKNSTPIVNLKITRAFPQHETRRINWKTLYLALQQLAITTNDHIELLGEERASHAMTTFANLLRQEDFIKYFVNDSGSLTSERFSVLLAFVFDKLEIKLSADLKQVGISEEEICFINDEDQLNILSSSDFFSKNLAPALLADEA